MITTNQKDQILQTLLEQEGQGTLDGAVIAKNVGIEPRHVMMVIDDLKRHGYITFLGMAQYYFQVRFTLDGYDFHKNGGFAAMEKPENNFTAGNLFNSSQFGNNATIIVGSNNIQTVNNTTKVKKGDFKSLEDALTEKNVNEDDIKELETVIDNDDTNFDTRTFGNKVNAWIAKMVGKAVNSSWEISIGIAGSFLYDVIKSYYGWHI